VRESLREVTEERARVRIDFLGQQAQLAGVRSVDRPEFLGGCDLWEGWDS
jgi:hypothetical protein